MKKIRKAILVFCASLLVLFVLFLPLDARTASLDSNFGVNSFVMNRYDRGEFQGSADLIDDLGVGWVREEFIWGQIEPEEGQFNWGSYDEALNSLKGSEVNVLGIINYSAPWATDDANRDQADKYMPDLAHWENYIGHLVDRYGDTVKYWEIWNEPNISIFFKPKPDVDSYLALLRSAHNIIQNKDSSARVVLGGMSGIDIGYIDQLVSRGGNDYFDIIALHPYRGSFDSVAEQNRFIGELRKIEEISSQTGGKSVWFTEIGWPTSLLGGVSEISQAKYLSQFNILSLSSSAVKKIFWYDLRNDGDDLYDIEQNFGLARTGFNKKPAFLAYQNLISILDRGEFVEFNSLGGRGIYDAQFKKGNNIIRAVWKLGNAGAITVPYRKDVRVYDMLGQEQFFGGRDSMTLALSDSPLYFISENISADIFYGQSYDYEFVSQSPHVIFGKKSDQTLVAELKIQNTGMKTWYNSDANPILLGTCRDRDRASLFFFDGEWIGNNRASRLQEDIVEPGEVGTFLINVRNNNRKGKYREYFCPVVEGVQWLKDIGIYWDITIK